VSDKPRPPFSISEREAAELIGEHLLVGVAHAGADETLQRLEQIHDIVVRANHSKAGKYRLENSLPNNVGEIAQKAAQNAGRSKLKIPFPVGLKPRCDLASSATPAKKTCFRSEDSPLVGRT